MRKKRGSLTKEEFVEKALKIFPKGSYDYSDTVYTKGREPVTILCNNCNSYFTMNKAEGHLQGRGCNLCCAKRAGNSKVVPSCEFLQKALMVNAELFGYDFSTYRGMNTPMRVFCNTYCQWMWKKPGDIARGIGHSKKSSEHSRWDHSDFMNRALKAHGNLYDYSKVPQSVKATDKITIICPMHGGFQQMANRHAFGLRCPKCVNLERFGGYCETNFQRDKRMAVKVGSCYLFECSNGEAKFLKVGITKYTNPHERLLDVRRHINGEAELIGLINTELYGCFLLEQYIHRTFKHLRYHTTTVFDGHTECLDISLKDTLVSLFEYINQKGEP